MLNTMEKPIPNQYYHILNRANGSDVLFREEDNYFFFIDKYRKHLHPVVETLAYALMGKPFSSGGEGEVGRRINYNPSKVRNFGRVG